MKNLNQLILLLLKDIIRDRFFLTAAAAAVLLLAAALPLSEMTVGDPGKTTISLSLSLLNLFALFVVMVPGVQSLSAQVNDKLLLFILARPLTRAQHLAAAAAAVLCTVTCGLLLISLCAYLLTLLQGPVSPLLFLSAVWLTLLEALLLVCFAALFCVITTPTLASFLTLFVYVIGHGAEQALMIMAQSDSFWRFPATFLGPLLPNLEFLNVKSLLVNNLPLPPSFFLHSFLYTASYAALVFWLASRAVKKSAA